MTLHLHINNQRGIALAHTAIGLVAFMALTAVGVDVAHLAFTATEVQNLADIAATAGAKHIVTGTGTAQSGAELLANENYVDGAKATGSNLDSVEVGHYDFDTETFTVGGMPNNAVRATASATVGNLLAGSIFGDPFSKVTKTATASFAGLGGARPDLPLAVGDCNFPDPDCIEDSCLPKLLQVPSPDDNSAWTGFLAGTGQSEISDLFPTDCGGSGVPDEMYLNEGDPINLNNGQLDPLLKQLEDCVAANPDRLFLVPTVECGIQYVQEAPVTGFATIKIDEIVATGNPKYIKLSVMFNATAPGPPGGGNFGSGSVVLVR